MGGDGSKQEISILTRVYGRFFFLRTHNQHTSFFPKYKGLTRADVMGVCTPSGATPWEF